MLYLSKLLAPRTSAIFSGIGVHIASAELTLFHLSVLVEDINLAPLRVGNLSFECILHIHTRNQCITTEVNFVQENLEKIAVEEIEQEIRRHRPHRLD